MAQSKWQKAHPEAVREIVRLWRKNNPERVKELSKKHRAKRYREKRDEILAYNKAHTRKWDVENPERKRAHEKTYAQKHPEKMRAKWNNHSVIRRRLIAKQPLAKTYAKQIIKIYQECPPGHHVDHIIPLRGKGVNGLHVPWNLQYLPASENIRKGARLDIIKWIV